MIGVVSCKKQFYLIFECFRFYFWRKKEILTNVPCSRSYSDGRPDACSYTVNAAVAACTHCLCSFCCFHFSISHLHRHQTEDGGS